MFDVNLFCALFHELFFSSLIILYLLLLYHIKAETVICPKGLCCLLKEWTQKVKQKISMVILRNSSYK